MMMMTGLGLGLAFVI